MRCLSVSSAVQYDLKKAVKYYSNRFEAKTIDDVLHVFDSEKKIDLFLFSFGCAVIWGGDEAEQDKIVKQFTKFAIEPIKDFFSDLIYFDYADQDNEESDHRTFIDEEQNTVILADQSEYIKLSISYGLAQSIKLEIFEESVTKILHKTAPISKELSVSGTTSMSKRDISKEIGILFSERYAINMNSDILDTPEFFWRRPNYEPLYLMTLEFHDIELRHNTVNRRLEMIQELYTTLYEEISYRHSLRIEIIIVLLIAIEVYFIIPEEFWRNMLAFIKSFL